MQYKINLAAAHWRARKQNEILPVLQEKFDEALNTGVLLELEVTAQSFVDELVEAALAETR